MKIRVKVGDVEIEYSEPTLETDYPKIISKDKFDAGQYKADVLMRAIMEIADKAAQVHKDMF